MKVFSRFCLSVVMIAIAAFADINSACAGTGSGTGTTTTNDNSNSNINSNIISIDDSNKAIAGGSFSNFGGGSISQNFESSIPLPVTAVAPSSLPTLFSLQGLPAQVTGIPMLSKNFFTTLNHDVAIGCSRGTKIIYNGSRPPEHAENENRSVVCNFNGVANGEVVGSITIQSRKDRADEVDIPTLIYDATHYINCVRELKGYNITLLTIPNTITYASGIDSRGTGYSVSPLVSGLFNAAHMMAGLATGYSKSGGVTIPTAIVGCTFLVLIDSNNAGVVNVTGNYNRPEPVMNTETGANGNGNGRKKYEAIRRGE
jgi:hypothetical protein